MSDQQLEEPINLVAPAVAPLAHRRLGHLELFGARILWKGREVELTRTEARVVELLATARADVTYRETYDVIRKPGFLAGNGPNGFHTCVRSMVKRIRQKFRTIDPTFDSIDNYPTVGYRWRHPPGFKP